MTLDYKAKTITSSTHNTTSSAESRDKNINRNPKQCYLKGYFHSTRFMAALRIGLPSDRHRSALFGRTAFPDFFCRLVAATDFPYFEACPFSRVLFCITSVPFGQGSFVAGVKLALGQPKRNQQKHHVNSKIIRSGAPLQKKGKITMRQ